MASYIRSVHTVLYYFCSFISISISYIYIYIIYILESLLFHNAIMYIADDDDDDD